MLHEATKSVQFAMTFSKRIDGLERVENFSGLSFRDVSAGGVENGDESYSEFASQHRAAGAEDNLELPLRGGLIFVPHKVLNGRR